MTRCLILSCTQAKRSDDGLLPALERYDGPTFHVVRRFLADADPVLRDVDIYVLSARYGLITADQRIADYDQRMTPARAAELRNEALGILANLLRDNDYDDICLAMSQVYLAALEGWSALLPQGVQVALTDGPQGIKLAKLKRWLWRNVQDDAKDKQREARPRGYARIRGVEVTMTPEQVLDMARKALAEGRDVPDRYYSWYVQVDDQQVAPKWLVSQLTGLPVSAFVTSEARRLLTQLGIKVMHV